MNLLNLGCGSNFHKEWINIDFVSKSNAVQAHNLLEGIPFEAQSIDVVYHSHVLEHFSKTDGIQFIKECFRVLKPQGVIRIAVPNLEVIAKEYLKYLDLAVLEQEKAKQNYDWIVLELFDQMIRNESGGNMKAYLQQEIIPNESYVFERIGIEGKQIRSAFLNKQQKPINFKQKSDTFLKKTKRYLRKILKTEREKHSQNKLTERERKALQIGQFRLGGEIHQWMYDRYSLSELLKQIGFSEVKVCSAYNSSIPNWSDYELDVINGEIRKPDSLFIEAIK
ncbi:MAG: methyltransferase domain-containing protein [Winogradskyella sp.]|nr:methyltransferase domain-containing protein [Winogradskyella sp.]